MVRGSSDGAAEIKCRQIILQEIRILRDKFSDEDILRKGKEEKFQIELEGIKI